MTIKLVKYQNRNGGKVLSANNGEIEMQESGLMIRFQAGDNRKPHHAVLIDNDDVRKMVDTMLVHLSKQ